MTNELVLTTKYSKYSHCKVSINRYAIGNSPCIDIYNKEDGPIARLTVCLGDPTLEEDYSYLDTNNCPWALDFIKTFNFGTDTGLKGASGYCTYPLIKWNMEELKKYI